MTSTVLVEPAARPAPRPATPDSRDQYWKRLREPDALVRRDLRLFASLAPRTPVLDVGCGNGAFIDACQRYGLPVIGVEAFSASARIAAWPGAAIIQAVGEHLPLTTASFDAIRLKEVLEHVQQPLVMATEMRRALRPGGTLLAYVPTQWSQLYPFPANFYDDYTHVRAFSRIGLTRLLEDAGFTHITVEGCTPPLRAWQKPIAIAASRVFPFLWRAVATDRSSHA